MRALLLGFTLLAATPALAAEKYVGSNVDVRTVLAFKVADAAVQKFLPEGWQPGSSFLAMARSRFRGQMAA